MDQSLSCAFEINDAAATTNSCLEPINIRREKLKGHPNPSFLPNKEVSAAFQAALSDEKHAKDLLQYGRMQGNLDLCEAICEMLKAKAGRKKISPSEIFITNGAGPGLSLICHLFTTKNDTIFVDSPAYFLSFYTFLDCELNIVEIPTDANGIDVDAVEARLRAGERPAMLYTVPIANNPTGVNLSDSRRERLVALSREFNFKIAADEVYQFLEFADKPSVGCFDLDDPKHPTVFSINSFSKILGPGIRLGWIETNELYMKRILQSGAIQSGGGLNPLASGMVLELMKTGFVFEQMDMLRKNYKETCATLCSSLQKHVGAALLPGENITFETPTGGFFCFLTLPKRIDTNRLLAQAQEKFGVAFFSGKHFSAKKNKFHNCIRLCFAYLESKEIDKGVMRLAEAVKNYS